MEESNCFILFVDPKAKTKPFIFHFPLDYDNMKFDAKEFFAEYERSAQWKGKPETAIKKNNQFIGFSESTIILACNHFIWHMDLKNIIQNTVVDSDCHDDK